MQEFEDNELSNSFDPSLLILSLGAKAIILLMRLKDGASVVHAKSLSEN